jgi:hypothetical protein
VAEQHSRDLKPVHAAILKVFQVCHPATIRVRVIVPDPQEIGSVVDRHHLLSSLASLPCQYLL